MKRRINWAFLAIGIAAGAAATYAYFNGLDPVAMQTAERHAYTGHAVHADMDSSKNERKILYYRNPMGLPDTSPVPKKDSMGMDYIPVYAEDAVEAGTIRVSSGKLQRSGVKTETADKKAISRTVRAPGIAEHDEAALTSITVRSDGYVEDLFVDKTGQSVKRGEPLFRFYSPQVQLAQADLLVALRARGRAGRDIEGALQKLRNLGVPETRIQGVRETRENPRTLDWPSPTTGDVTRKSVINGQFVEAGDELFRIADHTRMWVIAEVAEADIGDITVGTPARVTFRAFPNAPREAKVSFIYPEMRKLETRTIPVRIELNNEDGHIRPGMYADVVFRSGAAAKPVTAVPASAVIDSGTRKVVLIAKGDGRFEPRPVELGRRGEGYVAVLQGVEEGDEVVTSATFLIDSESNLKAALQGLEHQDETP
jgi:Cu(I)/Ag(I) efflux system membrane fusion protein